jgi:hypothetical protein
VRPVAAGSRLSRGGIFGRGGLRSLRASAAAPAAASPAPPAAGGGRSSSTLLALGDFVDLGVIDLVRFLCLEDARDPEGRRRCRPVLAVEAVLI